ncbi:hypothetical protein [Streptomyces atacamensis]|jgi:hypothetical protein|uniref:hypothetical protein n=1 Tax=Streptomyces atacamensis TaxID=531966 RepID=UPI00399C7398
MAGIGRCPSCGESEDLRGEPSDGDIKITCLRCAAQWMRGAPRCAGCGGTDIVQRPQVMTRHSRGTQLSIIGWRELPLCRVCDAEALEASITDNLPVPSDYVAVCLNGREDRPEDRPTTSPAPRTAPPERPRPSVPPAQRIEKGQKPRKGHSAGEPGPTPEPAAPAKPRTTPRPQPFRPKPAQSAVPTVRQAIAAFLTEASGTADATAMLLLGTHLGSYNRLSALDETGAADRLTAWCAGHWPDRGSDTAQRALDTIRRAVDFWGARGWLTTDPAAGIR